MIESEENPFDLGQDPDLEELSANINSGERVAIIRTSDRSNFRRCRRRWNWQSHLRGNLTNREAKAPLWFGSGFHYALEDYHGPRIHASPRDAFKEYVKATHRLSRARQNPYLLPPNWPELVELGYGMLDYYSEHWLGIRDPLRTFVYRGVPQVEVHALIPVPVKTPHYDKVLYACTLDRVVEFDNGDLGIVDYKTAKRFQTTFLQTDPQISAYMWIAPQLYPGRRVTRFIYQQHRKDIPGLPEPLATGRFATTASQLTSHGLYRTALISQYGAVLSAPKENVDFLNWLATQEDEDHDKFVRRDSVYRNRAQCEAEGVKLLMELEEMLNPDLPLYPSPTRDCGGMCDFNSACVSLDDGGDWEFELELMFEQKDAVFDSWRQYMKEAA
jgi:hypothetical protein